MYDPAFLSVARAIELIKPSSLPALEDIDIIQDFLNPTLFPGVSSSVKVHQGFRDAHAKYALLSFHVCILFDADTL